MSQRRLSDQVAVLYSCHSNMTLAPGARLGLANMGVAAAPGSIETRLVTSPPPQGTPPTGQGMILSTFQYMAPEQIEGQDADARTDIWGFGCVLYEMLTGKRAFDGKSQASLIASILERQPAPIAKLQPMTPSGRAGDTRLGGKVVSDIRRRSA